ncbi:MAG: hypothetical protein JXA06_08230 [Bacteroidetes bacterium]|nr:hypothetical protein [Bacteroidota bacterium]
MGLAQVASARIGALGAGGKLNMEKMPVTGLVRTHSANRLITCCGRRDCPFHRL